VAAFIGPACSLGCVSCGHLAAHWDLPMISYGCADAKLSDKDLFPTFVRTVGTFSQHSGDLFLRLMKHFKWDRIAILTSTERIWSQLASLIKVQVDAQPGYEVSYFESFSPEFTRSIQYQRMFNSAKKRAHGMSVKGN
jgi:ABC-type branched-subunit amino acid transport system substrate-binding protein